MMQLFVSLDQAIVELCRYARLSGLTVGVKESLDALRAAETVGVTDREILKMALRAVLCSSHAEWQLFEELFEDFWSVFERDSQPSAKRGRRSDWVHRPESQNQKTAVLISSQSNAELPEGAGGKA